MTFITYLVIYGNFHKHAWWRYQNVVVIATTSPYPMHITASVFISVDGPRLHHDYDPWLEKLAPREPTGQYRHNDTGEDNADAQLERQIMGREVVGAIPEGRLDFGTWEQIFCVEFDGRRRKRVLVKIMRD